MRLPDPTPQAFRFGPDLRLEAVQVDPDAQFSRASMLEEGLETLVALNLDRLFPQWSLSLKSRSAGHSADWSVPDILAVDPLGALHVFELKYGAPTRDSLMQAVAYGLRAATTPDWLDFVRHRQPLTNETVARDLAGVWTKSWASKVSAKGGTDRDKDLSRLQHLLRERPLIDEAMAHAKEHVDRLQGLHNPWPDLRVSPNLHLHLIVPSVPDEVLREAILLAGRGIRISLWEASVAFDQASRSGRLRLTPRALQREDDEPILWAGAQLLQGAVQAVPSLGQHRWSVGRKHFDWVDPHGYLYVHVHLYEEKPELYFAISVPTFIASMAVSDRAAVPEWGKKWGVERRVVSDYLAERYPVMKLLSSKGLSQLGGRVLYQADAGQRAKGGPVNPVEVWRSSGGKGLAGAVMLVGEDADHDPQRLGALLAPHLRDVLDAFQKHRRAGELMPYTGTDGRPLHTVRLTSDLDHLGQTPTKPMSQGD